MDVEMEEFLDEPFQAEEEFDIDFEYDAPKFYDFCLPETEFEAQQSELWFETSGGYPPSPHVTSWSWQPNAEEVETKNKNRTTTTRANSSSSSSAMTTSSKNSNFMNPTLSHLARQNLPLGHACSRLLRRSQTMLANNGKLSRSSSISGDQAAKRQKLEAGYLRMLSRQKHQAMFLHKTPQKGGDLDFSSATTRSKLTIPKEPNLETASRAASRRSKSILESIENTKSKDCNIKARPLNKKILKSPSFPAPKKSTPQLPDFQEFRLRTSARATRLASCSAENVPDYSPASRNEIKNLRRVNSISASREKLKALDKSKALCLNKKENSTPAEKKLLCELPLESFSKLSLATDVQSDSKSQSRMPLPSKGPKENDPSFLHLRHEKINHLHHGDLSGVVIMRSLSQHAFNPITC